MTTIDGANYFEIYGSQVHQLHPRSVSSNLTAEEMQDMPWGSEYLTTLEFMQWVASRKAAGVTIDIETCELDRWYCCDFDIYVG
jgi:hypothetical protein